MKQKKNKTTVAPTTPGQNANLQYRIPLIVSSFFMLTLLLCLYLLRCLFEAELQLSDALEAQIDRILNNVFIYGIGFIFLVTIILFFYTYFRISVPILKIKERADEIANGNYDSRDTIPPKRNELGLLADSISELALKIKDGNETTESERQRLDSVLAHMSDGVLATDRRGNVVLVNDAALTMLDKSKEDILGVSIMEVFDIKDKYSYRQLVDTEDELILSVEAEGQTSILKSEFTVIRRETGFISGLVAVLSDITEQEKVEQERRDFVSNVSHELRTPLTSMRSYTEALMDGAWKDENLAPRFLTVIQSETDRMIRMVSDLLSLSRLDREQESLRLELIDLTHLMQQTYDRYSMLLNSEEYQDKNFSLKQDFGQQSYWIEADEDRLMQVIDNVMNNAIKYSPDGGTITVRLIETNHQIVISITDEGLGIPKKAIPHVFKRFYRVDKARSREQGGTGLGLAIAKEVVERHKGKIWVSSKENYGSTFFIALPKVEFEAADIDFME